MTRYLDENGVAKLWERIQKLVYECGGKGGGGGCTCDNAILYLNEIKTEDDQYYYYTLDKSFAEIKDAWEHSKRIVVKRLTGIRDDETQNYLVYDVQSYGGTEPQCNVDAFCPSQFTTEYDSWHTDTGSTSEHPYRFVEKPN